MIQQIQQRNRTWDIVKGIGILLVVIAHTRDPLPLHRTIYLFHMGLFYFIGGYFLKVNHSINAKSSIIMFIKKKITALYNPYVIAGSLLLIMNPLFVSFGWDDYNFSFQEKVVGIVKFVILAGGGYMSVALWFAKSLFVVLIALYTIVRLVKSIYIQYIVFFLCYTVGWTLYSIHVELPWSMEREVTVLPLCYLGYLSKSPHNWRNILLIKPSNLWLKIALMILCIVFLYVSSKRVDISVLDQKYGFFGALPLYMIIGTTLCKNLSDIINRSNILANVLSYIGSHSLSIMILHIVAFRVVSSLLVIILNIPKTELMFWTIDLPNMWIVYSIFGVVLSLTFRIFIKKSFQIIKNLCK